MGLIESLYLSGVATLGLISHRLVLGWLAGADPAGYRRHPLALFGLALLAGLAAGLVPPLYPILVLVSGFGTYGRRWL